MAITKKQHELDVMKWLRSEEIGMDACGTFDFCVKCDKTKPNPCDKAYKLFNKKPVEKKTTAKKPTKKTLVKKEVAVTKSKK